MDKLYPIIRRQRRPLLAEDHQLPPVKPEAAKVVADGNQTEQVDKPKSNDRENVSQPEIE
jgi:hypothetical protein